MSYSRRQLEALGEPLGDSATRLKEGGFGRIYGGGGGGGGGGGSPVQQQTQISDLPEWAKGYAQDVLAKGQALTATPYQPYGGKRVAAFTPLQQQAFQGAAELGPTQQTALGSGLAATAGAGALGTQYEAGRFGAQQVRAPQLQNFQMQRPEDVRAMMNLAPGMQAAQTDFAPNLQTFQMGPAQQVRTQSFARPGAAEQFMSPYMQNVVDVQQREAQRQSDIQALTNRAQAVQAGAFGGSRQGLIEAERQRNLATQLGGIQAQGLQSAFQQAQQQFNAEQQARLAAQQANQQAGLTVGGQNLAAQLGVQQLGTQTGLQTALQNLSNRQQANVQNQAAQLQAMGLNSAQALQAALANQQTGLATGQQNLAALLGVQQLGAGQRLQAQQLNQAANLQAQQLAEQSRQYGAGLGLQGLQTGLQAAGTLGNLGAQQFAQQQGAIQAQTAAGAQQQAQQQKVYDTAYQDFLTQLNYPYQQLSYMSNLIRGTPMGMNTQSQVYQAPGSLAGQAAGLGLGAYGLSRLFGAADGGLMKSYKDGGQIKTYAGDEGSVTSEGFEKSQLSRMTPEQLATVKHNALVRRDLPLAQLVDEVMAENRSLQGGLGGAFNQLSEQSQEQMMAGGGMVAFAGGGKSDSDSYYQDPMGAPSYDTEDLSLRRLFGQNVREGEAYTPGLQGLLFGYNTLPSKDKAAAATAATLDTVPYNALTATRRSQFQDTAKAPAPAAAASPVMRGIAAGSAAVSGDSLLSEAEKAINFFDKRSQPDIDKLQAIIDKQQGKAEEIKKQGLDRALAEFGFGMAAQAAKPGQPGMGGLGGILRSAAAASPTLAASAAETQKLASAAEENASKLQIEYTKYKVALSKGDTQAAMQHATNVRQLQLGQQHIELQRQQIAQQGAYQQGALGIQREGLALREKAAQAQQLNALGRLAEVARKNGADFDSGEGKKLRMQLEKQYGPGDPRIAGIYGAARRRYIQENVQLGRDQQADSAAGVRSALDLLGED